MLTVYADESHDATRQRVFAVAGLLGNEADWSAAKKLWLERTGGEPFHAADCESEHADNPDRQLHKENLRLYADLAKILAKSNLMGFGAVMELPGWRAALPPSESDRAAESAYLKCFSEVVIYFSRIAGLSIPPDRVEFILDRNIERFHTATELYTLMATSPAWPHGKWLAERISSDTIASAEIQMADLLAREAMKYLDNEVGPVNRPVRQSLRTLMASRRFRVECYMPEYSQQLVASAAKWADQSGTTAERYQSWLKECRLADTLANRIKFVASLESPRAARKRPGLDTLAARNSPTESVGVGLLRLLSGDGRRLIVVIQAFIDESGTHDGASILSVAACATGADNWGIFAKSWQEHLDYANCKCFHAKEPACDLLRPMLVDTLAAKPVFCVVMSVDPSLYRHRAGAHLKSILGNAYAVCAFSCAIQIDHWSRELGLSEVAYVIEHGQPNVEYVVKVLDSLIGNADFRVAAVAKAKKSDFIQLQAADFLAHVRSTNDQEWLTKLRQAIGKTGQLVDEVLTQEQILDVSATIERSIKKQRSERRRASKLGGER